ncbi:MAG: 50S ribosomal protein L24 [Proteobacteria bacterium]|nr:50S ribosomal protein L24 [Pseudomonadota bacterium]MCH8188414.1 50S ribosomal protein L24 [Pseudomonadota bacterium]
MAAKIRRGDDVIVLSGRDKGKKGTVLKVDPKKRRAVVQGVNLAKRHTAPTQGDPGGIKEKELTIHLSNLALEDPKTGEPTRVGFKTLKDGKRVRVARRSGEEIDA